MHSAGEWRGGKDDQLFGAGRRLRQAHRDELRKRLHADPTCNAAISGVVHLGRDRRRRSGHGQPERPQLQRIFREHRPTGQCRGRGLGLDRQSKLFWQPGLLLHDYRLSFIWKPR